MVASEEKIILQEFQRALKNYYNWKNVVDADEYLHKINCYLFRIEDSVATVGFDIPPHRQARFIIQYIKNGEGEKRIGKFTFPVKKGTLMITPTGVTTSARYTNEIKGYYLAFNLIFFLQEQFPRNHLANMDLFNPDLRPYVYLDAKQGKKIEDIFEDIFEEGKLERKNTEYLFALKILELLLLSDRLFNKESNLIKAQHPPVLLCYIDLIEHQYKEEHSIAYYAGQLHTHPNALNALCKRHLGQPAKSILDVKLITESKYLLQQTNMSVKEIAYEVGFQSPSHFFRFFKRHTANSPAQYRMQPFEIVVS